LLLEKLFAFPPDNQLATYRLTGEFQFLKMHVMDSHYILALETSSSRCDVALLCATAQKISVQSVAHDATGEHAERLLPLADSLLDQAGIGRTDLTAIAFGQGPGGFTGLRVACGVAQGIAFALDLPVVPIVSLLAVAALDQSFEAMPVRQDRDYVEPVRVLVQDARMGEVYLAAYRLEPARGSQAADWQVLQAPVLLDAADVGGWLGQISGAWRDACGARVPVRLLGDALEAYPELMALGAEMIGASAPAQAAPGLAPPESGDALKVGSDEGVRVQFGEPLRPTAEAIARLAFEVWQQGGGLDPQLAAPLYVRDKVAYTTQERKQGLGGNPKAMGLAIAAKAGSPSRPSGQANDLNGARPLTDGTGMITAPEAPGGGDIPPVPSVVRHGRLDNAMAAATGGADPDPVLIEPMTLVHLDAVFHIEQAVQSFPWTRENFFDALHAGYGAWVARQGNKIVGFCLVMFAPDVAHLLLIAVAPEAQRKGVGAVLLHQSERESLEHGVDSLILEVRPSNRKALAFYRRHGFISLSVRKGYYPVGRGEREDALVLQKKLLASGDVHG
jgi:tRNA threonylcarbamoyladenosine biosynthesis protein TsaB